MIGISKPKGCIAGENIPDLDGIAAKISGSAVSNEKTCTFCDAKGHTAVEHLSTKESAEPSGEALKNDKATQYGWVENESNLTTGNEEYELPGARGKKSIYIFG